MTTPTETTRPELTSKTNPHLRFWLIATLVGLALRVVLLPVSTYFTYTDDHELFSLWGLHSAEQGITTIYHQKPEKRIGWEYKDNQWHKRPARYNTVCNYPPLSVYLLHLSGHAFKALSNDGLINTTASKTAFCIWAIIADLILAAGVAAIVALYRQGRAARWAYISTLLIPPLWWDSVMWGQMDSVALAPAVWMLYAMLQRRWLLAGVLYGIMAGLKPQAAVFIPIWGLAIVLAWPSKRTFVGLFTAAVVFALVTLPFTLTGGLAWWRISYEYNLFRAYTTLTTLKAFNIWYLDLLITDSAYARDRIFGLTKAYWGKELLGIALVAGFAWLWYRWRNKLTGLLPWAVFTLLAAIMLPTRVHERYILLVIPFLITAALVWRRFVPGLVLLLIVATFSVTWPQWMVQPPGSWSWVKQQAIQEYYNRPVTQPGIELSQEQLEQHLAEVKEQYLQRRQQRLWLHWVVTICALSGTLVIVVAAVSLKPDPQTQTITKE